MPLHDYAVLDKDGNRTNIKIEKLFFGTPPERIVSQDGDVAVRCISAPARTNCSWADSAGTRYGVNGYFNRGLGIRVNSDAEADRIAKERGLVRLDDFDRHMIDDKLDVLGEEARQENKRLDAFQADMQKKSWTSS